MYTANGPIFEHNGDYFALEWSGATQPEEDSYFGLQDALMNASSFDELHKELPEEYRSIPLNLVAGFENGDISYHMLASLYSRETGNQVLDGTIASDKSEFSLVETRDLPH